MDTNIAVEPPTLSYDEEVPYEEQVAPEPEQTNSLASRIGKTKVYLLSEQSTTRASKNCGKRKHEDEDTVLQEEDEDGDVAIQDGLSYRQNAILFQGPPIKELPTAHLFAYATSFDARPMGLEWISDDTCVFVFETKAAARAARKALQKSATTEEDGEDIEGFIIAKSIPTILWPPEQRINATLGKGEGLKGVMRMRWATHDDVKKKGAKKESDFYRKYGSTAGKPEVMGLEAPRKRRRRGNEVDSVDAILEKTRLDDDLDSFLAESEAEEKTPEPPSKMYSDYIASDGRTLLERTSSKPNDLLSRFIAPLPRRARERDSRRDPASRSENKGRRSRRERRPQKKSQQDLDDELDAFLKERD